MTTNAAQTYLTPEECSTLERQAIPDTDPSPSIHNFFLTTPFVNVRLSSDWHKQDCNRSITETNGTIK